MFHPLLPQHVVLVLGNALFAVEVIGDFACAHVSFGTLEISIGDQATATDGEMAIWNWVRRMGTLAHHSNLPLKKLVFETHSIYCIPLADILLVEDQSLNIVPQLICKQIWVELAYTVLASQYMNWY